MLASPADIMRQLLVDAQIGADPPTPPAQPGSVLWPIYASKEPDLPDDVITVFNTAGLLFGRDMIRLRRVIRPGLQFRVRCGDEGIGWAKMKEVYDEINRVYDWWVMVGGVDYVVHSIMLTGTIIPLGMETSSNRMIWVLNGVVSLQQLANA